MSMPFSWSMLDLVGGLFVFESIELTLLDNVKLQASDSFGFVRAYLCGPVIGQCLVASLFVRCISLCFRLLD